MNTFKNIPVIDGRVYPDSFQEVQYVESQSVKGFGVNSETVFSNSPRRKINAIIGIPNEVEYTDDRYKNGIIETLEIQRFIESCQGSAQTFWLNADIDDIAEGYTRISENIISVPGAKLYELMTSSSFYMKIGNIYTKATASIQGSNTWIKTEEVIPVLNGVKISRLYLVRFSSEEITMNFVTPVIYQIPAKLIEVPEEYDNRPRAKQPVFLYYFKDTGISRDKEWFVTSYAKKLILNGQEYAPAAINHDSLEQSAEGSNDKCNINMFSWDGHPFSDWIPVNVGGPIDIKITRAEINDDLVLSNPVVIFIGTSNAISFSGAQITVAVNSKIKVDTRLPCFLVQTTCNYQLYEPNTCRLAVKRYSARVTKVEPTYIEVLTAGGAPTDSGTYDFGMIIKPATFVSGTLRLDEEYRSITRSDKITGGTGGNMRVYIKTATKRIYLNDNILLYPGCAHTYDACKKFGNDANYGGCPFIPSQNPTLKALEVPGLTGGNKK